MKQVLVPAAFNPAAKTVDFSNVAGFAPGRLLAVVNTTSRATIYDPVTAGLGLASISGSVLTLQFDTTAQAVTDHILAFYDDGVSQASDVNLTTIAGAAGVSAPALASGASGLLGWLRRIVDTLSGGLQLTSGGNPLSATNRLPVEIDASNAPLSVSGLVSVSNLPATQAVSAAALPLPSGAATSALQNSILTALGSPLQAGGTVNGNLYVAGSVVSSSNPVPVIDAYQAPVSASWTSATGVNTALSVSTGGMDTVILTVAPPAGLTAGAITFEAFDGTNWVAIKAPRSDSYLTDATFNLSASPGTHSWQLSVAGYPQARARLSSAIVGSGAVGLVCIVSSAPDVSLVTVGLDPNQQLPAGSNNIGSVSVANFPSTQSVSDAQSAPFAGTVAMTVGATYGAQRSIGVLCTVAGNVDVQFSDGSTLTLPVYVGWQTFPFAVTQIVAAGTTATAIYYNLK